MLNFHHEDALRQIRAGKALAKAAFDAEALAAGGHWNPRGTIVLGINKATLDSLPAAAEYGQFITAEQMLDPIH